MAEFKNVAKLAELNDGEVKGVKVGKEEIALYRLGNEVLATTDICTHEFCVISENYNLEGDEVECTCHGSHYNIRTGANTVPPSAEPLRVYKTEVRGEDVYVEI